MIGKLKNLFATDSGANAAPEGDDPLQLAVAVLLVEIARADHDHSDREDSEIRQQLAVKFGLNDDETAELLEIAKREAKHSVSLHDYTRQLHESMSYDQKQRVIEMLWRIALADNSLDKYEDYMVGKIADLLYVSRGDVIRLRHRAGGG